ncbi:MAG: hypothetical protein QOF89_935 [Acidobacteriota bacterium]|nr:hypothetical protein [Acidobacteriota bacterium]
MRTSNVDGAPSAPYGNPACMRHPSPPGRGAGGEVSKGKPPPSEAAFRTPSPYFPKSFPYPYPLRALIRNSGLVVFTSTSWNPDLPAGCWLA